MSDSVPTRPAICLNMIVKNEAHIVHELLDSVAPYISSWVIVDTGSTDGTQDLIRNQMARLGVPGELYERPWRNFGHNRTEAINLAKGQGDYILVIDADDILIGTPDFTQLSADAYQMRYKLGDTIFWRLVLFRDGLSWRWEGVLHEAPACDEPFTQVRLEGEYHIAYRRLGARSQDPQKTAREEMDLLLPEVERNPEDARSVIFLAELYFNQSDYANARKWYARRAEMGGLDQHVYASMYGLAVSMARLGEPWPDVQDAYLKAWAFRPTRAEPLYQIAVHYRVEKQYWLGHLFAESAAQIPFAEADPFADAEVYAWRAADEQAVCASNIGRHAEAFTLCRRLLARPDLPDERRRGIAYNRDFSVPTMIEAALPYPAGLVNSLVAGPPDAEVTVSLVAGPDRETTELTLNSLLHCCLDVSRVGRFLVLDDGLSAQDRAALQERYRFLEFADFDPGDVPGAELAQLRRQIGGRFWLHLGQGWQFFAPDNYITRLTAVLDAEANVFQVGINFVDAVKLNGACATEQEVRRGPTAGRYVLTDTVAGGPAMFDTTRVDRAADGLRTASLDEVLCIKPPKKGVEYLRSLQEGFARVEGSSDEAELNCLADLASRPGIKTIGEIGFNVGISAHNFLSVNPAAVLYSFDIGEHQWVRPAADYIARTFPGRFELTYGDSTRAVPDFHRRHPELKFDLVFIDGGHDYAVARQDLLNMRDLAHATTVLVIDDLVPWEQDHGVGPARAWADLLDEGVVTCDEIWQDGRRVDAPAPPGSRVWGVGRYVRPAYAHLGGHPVDPQQRERDLLLAESMRNLCEAWSTLRQAQRHFDDGDFVEARAWYARRAEMGGSGQEVYHSMLGIAHSMARLDAPWPEVKGAFLRAWQFRPTRAESLYHIAVHYRVEKDYRLGYLFAERAAAIPLPEEDNLFVNAAVYAWCAVDEQAVCASWIGKHAEAFTLCRRLLARPDLPDERRQGIAYNRDVSVPAMLEASSCYPQALVAGFVVGPRDAEVTVSLVAGPDCEATEHTLNSFLHCCTDLSRVGRFVVVDVGLSAPDRAKLRKHYGFIEFAPRRSGDGPKAQLGRLRQQIGGRFWLHLGQGWRFFASENYITRLSAVLDAEPRVVQVGINYGDAVKLTNTCAAEQEVRRAPDAGRYVLTDEVASGPAMFDTARLDQVSPLESRPAQRGGGQGASAQTDTDSDPIVALGRRATAAGLSTASLDEVLCVTAI